ncbi:ROK family protein [bacterium]|nr:ROK family protein [bacterium]
MNVPTRPELVVIPNSATPADRSVEKRRLRKHAVLNVIRLHGPLSRADISKASGFNLPSVSSLVDELVEDKLVIEEEARHIPRGRRPIPLYLNADAASILGIDIGKETTIAIAMNLAGETIGRFETKTPACKTDRDHSDWALKALAKTIDAVDRPLPPICGVGVALPGLVARGGASIGDEDDHSVAIQKAIQDEFGVPTIVENDARMMAMGALWFGAGKSLSSFAVINIGHGIGMGLVLEGKVFTGKQGFAGELGFVPLGDPGVKGFLGHPECLQNVVSGTGLIRLAKEAGLKVRSAGDLAELARARDPKALAIFDRFTRGLTRAVATVINLFDVEAVILSGRVCRSADLFFEPMKQELPKHALAPTLRTTKLLLSDLDVNLGPMGAAASILHQIFSSAHVQVDEVI